MSELNVVFALKVEAKHLFIKIILQDVQKEANERAFALKDIPRKGSDMAY